MRQLLNNLIAQYETVYRDQSYLVQMKAKLLAAFALLVIVFAPLNLIKLVLVQPPWIFFRVGFNVAFLVAGVLAIRWVLKGKIQHAGNGLAILAVVPVHVLMWFVPEFREPLSAAITLFIFDMIALLIAIVFASRPVAFCLLAVMVLTQVAFHVLVLRVEPFPGSMRFAADTLFRDGLISIAFAFALGTTLAILIETAQKRSEAALLKSREMTDNLERLVAERTKELEAATARANQASRAKGDYLANMSHELRTPLHAIIAASELLLNRRDLPMAAIEKSRIIAQSGELLMKQIGEILDLSKIESGQVDLESVPFDLPSLIQECLQIMRPKAEEGGLTLDGDMPVGIPELLQGDSFRLRQVLLNLLSNAIKFTPSGGRVKLSLTPEKLHSREVRVRFEVHDTGIGMASEVVEKIFDRFSQAGPSITRNYGGTGLGLSISFQLVELMGGRLQVNSRPGEGSQFYFSLPFQVPKTSDLSENAETQQFESLGLDVVIADDNPVNRRIIGLQLEKLGCFGRMNSNGQELLDCLRTGPKPDLVLIDCEMPVMDGWETTRILRSWAIAPSASEIEKAASDLPVIALTAATSAEDRARCQEAGMNDFLSKPIKLQNLERALRNSQQSKPISDPATP